MKVFFLAAALWALLWTVLRNQSVLLWTQRRWALLRQATRFVCAGVICLTVVCGLVTVVTERVRFYEESTVLSTVAAFHHGQPLYLSAQAPMEYSLLYGPVTYFAYLPPMLAGAERLQAYEAWSILALALLFGLNLLALGRRYGTTVALVFCSLMAAIFARVTGNIWAIKADVWILFFSSMGLYAALRLRPWMAALLVAVSGAALVDLKLTLLLIALLPCVLLAEKRSGRLPAGISCLLLASVTLLPFLLPGVSLRNYLQLLLEYSGRSTSWPMLRINTEMTTLILLPSVTLLWAAFRADGPATRKWLIAHRGFLVLFLFASVVATLTGAKDGGGPWHCVVLAVFCLFVNAELWSIATRCGVLAFLLTPTSSAPFLAVGGALLLTFPLALAAGVRERLRDSPGDTPVSMRAVENDLLDISKRYPNRTLQMGYSDRAHYNLTFTRPILQIRGNPLLLDANARNEADLVHKPLSPALLEALAQCKIQVWIIPKGGVPFSMLSPYYLDPLVNHKGMSPDLYPEVFRKVFQAHYVRINDPSRYFNLWACRLPAGG